MNFYTRSLGQRVAAAGAAVHRGPRGSPTWAGRSCPHVMTEHLLPVIAREYLPPPIYITENGMANADRVVDGHIDDAPRIDYLQRHLRAVAQAMEGGADVAGYFLLEPAGQLRMGLGLREALRPVPRRLCDAAAHCQGQRALVPRHHRPPAQALNEPAFSLAAAGVFLLWPDRADPRPVGAGGGLFSRRRASQPWPTIDAVATSSSNSASDTTPETAYGSSVGVSEYFSSSAGFSRAMLTWPMLQPAKRRSPISW